MTYFILKYDTQGNELWANSAGGNRDDEAHGVHADAAGNVYVGGAFKSSSFSFGNTILNNNGSTSYYDIFVLKYDAQGNELWANSTGGSSDDEAYSIHIDVLGSIYLTGYYRSSSLGFGGMTLNNSGYYDILVLKYDAQGNESLARTATGSSGDYGRSSHVDTRGNLYIAGYFSGSLLDFNGVHLSNSGGEDVFLAKIRTPLWCPDDNSCINELQDLSSFVSGNDITIGINNGAGTTFSISDADADSTNELQTLSLSGSDLSISKGNTLSLPDFSKWTENASAIYYDAGAVGVGTTAPLSRLHVANGNLLMDNGRFLSVTRSDDGFAQQLFGMDGNNDVLLNRSAIVHGKVSRTVVGFNGRSFDVRNGSNQTLLRVLPNGNTGIGQGNPSYTLDVNGDGRINTQWVVSDGRYKKNVKSLEGAVEKLKAVKGVSYKYRQEAYKDKGFTGGTAYGFIAQELKEVLPELVSEDREGFYAVNYDGLIPLLTEAVKELEAKQKEHTMKNAEINTLKRENAAIKRRLDEMERLFRELCDHGCEGFGKKGNVQRNNAETPVLHEEGLLFQNEPNPFRERTVIRYRTPEAVQEIAIVIYSLQGERLKSFHNLNSGLGSVSLNAGSLAAGTYLYSLLLDGQEVATRRMVLTK